MTEETYDKIEFVKEKWVLFAGGFLLLLIVGIFGLIISGVQDCDLISIKSGVVRTCDCQGFEVTVKSTANSGEQKTICLGRIVNKKTFQENK